MDNYWLHIPVEVKHREFHSRLILTALAVDRGFRVLIGKDQMFRRLAPVLPKGILFDKSLGTSRHGKTKRYNSLGHKVVVHDEETTGYFGSPEHVIRTRVEDETLDLCESWYCLNETILQDVASTFPQHQSKFVLSGLMRTDTWREDFLGFYEESKLALQNEIGPFILFNSNFGSIIHARGDAFVNKQIKGMRGAYEKVDEVKERILRESKPNLDSFLELLPKLCEWYPDHKIIIRPHPSENVRFWQDHFENHANILVRNDGVATPWILASDMLIHHGCTTGVEAEILGKQHLMYAPFPDEHHDTEVMKAFAPIVNSLDDVNTFVSKNLGKPVPRRKQEEKSRYFANLDGQLVMDAIIADLEKHRFSSDELKTRLPLGVKLRVWIANNKKRSQKDKAYSRQKWPGATTEEIQEGLTVASEGLGLNQIFQINEVFDEVWEVGLKQEM